jgi:hypothetical protein
VYSLYTKTEKCEQAVHKTQKCEQPVHKTEKCEQPVHKTEPHNVKEPPPKCALPKQAHICFHTAPSHFLYTSPNKLSSAHAPAHCKAARLRRPHQIAHTKQRDGPCGPGGKTHPHFNLLACNAKREVYVCVCMCLCVGVCVVLGVKRTLTSISWPVTPSVRRVCVCVCVCLYVFVCGCVCGPWGETHPHFSLLACNAKREVCVCVNVWACVRICVFVCDGLCYAYVQCVVCVVLCEEKPQFQQALRQ